MLFSNLLFAVALTTVWPLGMLGLLAACAWLERRTLVAEEVVPRRLRRMESKPPEAVEAMVNEETSAVIADYWSTPTRPYFGTAPSPNGQRPAPAEPAGEPATPAAEDAAPLRAVWPRDAGEPRTSDDGRQPAPPAPPEVQADPEPAPLPDGEQRAGADPEPPAPRVAPGRAARLARRRPARGRHERH
jgi:hypothetical protein